MRLMDSTKFDTKKKRKKLKNGKKVELIMFLLLNLTANMNKLKYKKFEAFSLGDSKENTVHIIVQ